jgi:hypothetical protein
MYTVVSVASEYYNISVRTVLDLAVCSVGSNTWPASEVIILLTP